MGRVHFIAVWESTDSRRLLLNNFLVAWLSVPARVPANTKFSAGGISLVPELDWISTVPQELIEVSVILRRIYRPVKSHSLDVGLGVSLISSAAH